MKIIFRFFIFIICIDIIYITYLWVASGILFNNKVPSSNFINQYVAETSEKRSLPRLRWKPVKLKSIPNKVIKVFVIAEDARFFTHNGFDLVEIKKVLVNALKNKSISRGASTISQQTAKNLFLYPKRSWLRKWHEMIFTIMLEATQSKQRILEIYLNIAEFGQGVYGVNAATYYYFNLPVSAISTKQAAYLAATLPSPQLTNPKVRTTNYRRYAHKIYNRVLREHIPYE